MIWKIHGFVSFRANLTHFEAKRDIPGLHHILSSLIPTTYTDISDLAHFWSDWHQVQQIVGSKEGVGIGVGEQESSRSGGVGVGE